MKKTILTVIAILFFANIFAQDTLNSNYVDTKTYDYYLSKNWNSLIELGKKAHKNDIDFYYLQVRMGIAYYEKEKYRKAIKHFEKALKENENDALLSEYLYYSYLFSGREQDALAFSRKISKNLRKKIGIKQPIVKNINVSGFYLTNNKKEKLLERDIDGEDNIYGMQQFDKYRSSYGIGLENRIGRKILISYNFSQAFSSETQQIAYNESNYFFNINNSQNKYYAKTKLNIAKGFNFTTAFNYLQISTNTNNLDISSESSNLITHNTSNIFDTVYQVNAVLDVYDTIFDYNKTYSHKITDTANNWNDYAVAFSLWKDFKNIKLGFHYSKYKLNGYNFSQPAISLVYYPLSNINLYFATNINNQLSRSDSSSEQKRGRFNNNFVFSQTAGFKITDNIWSELYYKQGDLKNYADNNAFTIYNIADGIKKEAGAELTFLMFKNKLKFTLSYSAIQRENSYITTVVSGSYDKSYDGLSYEKYTYEDNSVYWNEPIDFTEYKTIDIDESEYNKTLYINHILIGKLTWYF